MKFFLISAFLLFPTFSEAADHSAFVKSCQDTQKRLFDEQGHKDEFGEQALANYCISTANDLTAQGGWANMPNPKREGCRAALISVFMMPESQEDQYVKKYCN